MCKRWLEMMESKFKCSKFKNDLLHYNTLMHAYYSFTKKSHKNRSIIFNFRHPSIDRMKQGFECLEGLLEQVSQAMLQNYSYQLFNQGTL